MNSQIKLLRNEEVIKWLLEDFSFLPEIEKKNKTVDTKKYKELEDIWGRQILKTVKRPDLKLEGQWTNKFGEHICEELIILMNGTFKKPIKIQNYQPDLEDEHYIWEVKTGTYFTEGTADEKILGCPFKYADIPHLYGKPLKILCIGGSEKKCREQFGNLLGEKTSPQKNKFLQFFKENGIEFVGITDILKLIHP